MIVAISSATPIVVSVVRFLRISASAGEAASASWVNV
jgi:hypothetical protein